MVLWLIVFHAAFAVNVTIISVLPYSIDVGVNLRWTGPALIAAVDDANLLYEPRHHAVLKLIFNKSHQSCDRAREDVPRMLAEFYYEQELESSCVVIIGASKLSAFWKFSLRLFQNDCIVFTDCVDMDSVADLARGKFLSALATEALFLYLTRLIFSQNGMSWHLRCTLVVRLTQNLRALNSFYGTSIFHCY